MSTIRAVSRIRALLVLLLLVLGTLVGSAAPPSALASNNYLIAFTAALDIELGDVELGGIFVVRPDGTGLRQLTRFQTVNYDFEAHGLNLPDDHPAFSPDGRKIAFTSNRDDPHNWEIYLMDVNGTNVRRLTDAPGLDTEPVFSPDGTRIAFVSERFGNLDLYTMKADGSDLKRLTTTAVEEIEPAWSPDGTLIAFTRVLAEGEKDIFILNAVDGSGVRRLTTAAGEDHDPTFSPDGTALVITSERDGTRPFGDVFKIRVSDGASLGNLTANLSLGGGDPAWSPDGTRVAFFRAATPLLVPPMELWLMEANGTNYTKFENQGLLNIHPNWGRLADSDFDGRPDYLEPDNLSFRQRDLPGPGTTSQELPGDQLGAATALADLTHDGYPDFFAGIPGEDVEGVADAGRVAMMFGSPLGPWFHPSFEFQFPLSMDAVVLGSSRRTNGRLGQTMASCDFNGDGFTDLAIGAPGQNSVFVSIGVRSPWTILTDSGLYGAALATGDFNRDGLCDLAVGAPQHVRLVGSTQLAAGMVRVHYGSAAGLTTASQIFDQGNLPIVAGAGPEEVGDQFGAALAAGDLNGDGVADLAVGVPRESWSGRTPATAAGVVHVIPGSTTEGLQPSHGEARDGRHLPSPYTGLQSGALFGHYLATGDFNQDLFRVRDLVVGIPEFDAGTTSNTGLVAVFDGGSTASGTLLAGTARAYTTADAGAGAALESSRFGHGLAAGDFSGDGVDDLAVAAPTQAVSGTAAAGQLYLIFGSKAGSSAACQFCIPVTPLFGSGGGLVPASTQRVTQSQVGGAIETGDRFGGSLLLPGANTLSTDDLNKDGQDDLLIGTPEEDIAASANTGLVSVRYGVKVGISILTPTIGAGMTGDLVTFTLTWVHPQRWRALETLHLRLRGADGIAFWARFDETTTTFSLFDPAVERFMEGVAPASATILETETAILDGSHSTVTGSGAEGPSVTLVFALRLKPPAAGRIYTVELLATDDDGHSQGFDGAGTWYVGPFSLHLPLVRN